MENLKEAPQASTDKPEEDSQTSKISPDKRHACTWPGCKSSFGRPSRLVLHLRVHTGERPFKCNQCDCSYTRSYHLTRHVSENHETKVAASVFLCPSEGCGKFFSSEQKRKIHFNSHHSEANRIKCDVCGITFRKNQHLKTHQYQHTGIPPYQCDVEGCGKRFKVPSKLKAHSKTHKGYTCDVEGCNQHFDKWTAYLNHKSFGHRKSTYDCSKCDKKLKSKKILEDHSKTHESTREVFHCPFVDCSVWSYYQRNLVKHINVRHSENPPRFKCAVDGCGKEFLLKHILRKHMTTHTAVPKDKEVQKEPKPKKPRSDKGKPKPKFAMAAVLSGFPISKEENNKILRAVSR